MSDDHAWVAVDTPLEADVLLRLARRPELLLRINPQIAYARLRRVDHGRLRLKGTNLAAGRSFALDAEVVEIPDGADLIYAAGLKCRTRLRVEPGADGGSRLVVSDHYTQLTPDELNARLDEVDRTLVAWGRALHGFLRAWAHRSGNPLWRWWMLRLWLPMTPAGRRAVRILLWLTAAEFAAFLLVTAVWVLES